MVSNAKKALGLRIKACRVLTGLNQEQFAKACSINHTSLRNWEFGRVAPRIGAIDKLIDSFFAFGIDVAKEWILFGHKSGPTLREPEKLAESENRHNVTCFGHFESYLKKNGAEGIALTVSDQEMEPLFFYGDRLFATVCNLNELDNLELGRVLKKPLIVKSPSGKLMVRWLNFDGQRFWAKKNNSSFITAVDNGWSAKIIWHISNDVATN